MRKIGLKDAFSPSVVVEGSVVETQFAVRPSDSDNSPRYVVECEFDFSDVPSSEVLKLATRTLVIDMQRRFRTIYLDKEEGGPEVARSTVEKTHSVKELLENARPKSDPVAKIKALAGKLSAEELRALVADLSK